MTYFLAFFFKCFVLCNAASATMDLAADSDHQCLVLFQKSRVHECMSYVPAV